MTICTNPRCGQEFIDKIHAGQQKKYCNRQCKNKHWEATEYSESRIKYLKSDRGKASQQRRSSKYRQTERGKYRYESNLQLQKLLNKRDSINRKANTQKVCKVCFSLFNGFNPRLIVCSDICHWLNNLAVRQFRPCEQCGLMGIWKQKFCSDRCQRISYKSSASYKELRRKKARRNKVIRRIRFSSQFIEDVNPLVMAERDNWTCHICCQLIDKTLKYPDRYSLSTDHVIPIAKGGTHGYENCKASHWICNVLKSDKVDNA